MSCCPPPYLPLNQYKLQVNKVIVFDEQNCHKFPVFEVMVVINFLAEADKTESRSFFFNFCQALLHWKKLLVDQAKELQTLFAKSLKRVMLKKDPPAIKAVGYSN